MNLKQQSNLFYLQMVIIFMIICFVIILIVGFSIFLVQITTNKKKNLECKKKDQQYVFSEALYYSKDTTPLELTWSYDFTNTNLTKDQMQFDIEIQTCTDPNNISTCTPASGSNLLTIHTGNPILKYIDNDSIRNYTYILDKNSQFAQTLTTGQTYYLSIRANYDNNSSDWTIPNELSSVYATDNIEEVPYFSTWLTAVPGQKFILMWNQTIISQPNVTDQTLLQTNCYRITSMANHNFTNQKIFEEGPLDFYNISFKGEKELIVKVTDQVVVSTDIIPKCTPLNQLTNKIFKTVSQDKNRITYTFYLVSNNMISNNSKETFYELRVDASPYGNCFNENSQLKNDSSLQFTSFLLADPSYNNNKVIQLSLTNCCASSASEDKCSSNIITPPITNINGSLVCANNLYLSSGTINTSVFTLPCSQVNLKTTSNDFFVADNLPFQGALVTFNFMVPNNNETNQFLKKVLMKYPKNIFKSNQIYPPFVVYLYIKPISSTDYNQYIYSIYNPDIQNGKIQMKLYSNTYTCYMAIYLAEYFQGCYIETPILLSNELQFTVNLPTPTSLVVINEN